MGPRPSRIRCLLVWAVVSVVVGAPAPAVLRGGSAGVRDGLAGGRFDTVLMGCCLLALLGCAGWAWLVTTAVVAQLLRHHGGPRTRPRPGLVRRLVLVACGAALAGGLAAPALATPGPMPLGHGSDPLATALVGLPLPDRAVDRPARTPAPTSPTVDHPTEAPPAPGIRVTRVEVAPGDTLWQIAADDLVTHRVRTSDADVERAWRAIYALNRDVIGADPDLILPATRLRMPGPQFDAHPRPHPRPLEETR